VRDEEERKSDKKLNPTPDGGFFVAFVMTVVEARVQ